MGEQQDECHSGGEHKLENEVTYHMVFRYFVIESWYFIMLLFVSLLDINIPSI